MSGEKQPAGSRAIFHGYMLVTTRVRSSSASEGTWKGAALDPVSGKFIEDEAQSLGWPSQAEAEAHAEKLARDNAAKRGYAVPADARPEWKTA